jgi:hypothetical protein
MSFDQTCLQNKISSFQSAKVHPTPMQLALASGLCGYSISPHGAQKLLKAILPLSPTIPALGTTIKNTGIDLAMAAVYSQLQIFASFPPLVATENKKSFSTVQSS